jgi:hypothetical protein
MSDEKKDGGGEEAKAGEGGCVADPPKEVEVGAGPPPAPIDISGGLQHHVVPTERCGALNVYVEVRFRFPFSYKLIRKILNA